MDRVTKLSDLDFYIGKKVVITITYSKHEMASIKIGKVWISEGNHWDFHPGCFGGWHFELEKETRSFKGPASMAVALSTYLNRIGAASVEIKNVDRTR